MFHLDNTEEGDSTLKDQKITMIIWSKRKKENTQLNNSIPKDSNPKVKNLYLPGSPTHALTLASGDQMKSRLWVPS